MIEIIWIRRCTFTFAWSITVGLIANSQNPFCTISYHIAWNITYAIAFVYHLKIDWNNRLIYLNDVVLTDTDIDAYSHTHLHNEHIYVQLLTLPYFRFQFYELKSSPHFTEVVRSPVKYSLSPSSLVRVSVYTHYTHRIPFDDDLRLRRQFKGIFRIVLTFNCNTNCLNNYIRVDAAATKSFTKYFDAVITNMLNANKDNHCNCRIKSDR